MRSVKLTDSCDVQLETLKLLALKKYKVRLNKNQVVQIALKALGEKFGLGEVQKDEPK